MKIIKSFKTFESSELDNFAQSLKIQVENAIEEIKPEIELYDYNVDVIELNDRKVEIHAETGGVPDEYTGYGSPRYSVNIDGTLTMYTTHYMVSYEFDGEITTGEGQTIIVNESDSDLNAVLKKVFYELVHSRE
jgi:hypothetical protein